MATVTIDVAAFDRLTGQAAEGGIREALGEYERLLKTDVLNRPGTGKIYTRPGGRKHQASEGGQPPARDLGNLVANTNADPSIRHEGDDVSGQVVANSAYARTIHEGTERRAPRPFMDVPAKDHQRALSDAFARGARR